MIAPLYSNIFSWQFFYAYYKNMHKSSYHNYYVYLDIIILYFLSKQFFFGRKYSYWHLISKVDKMRPQSHFWYYFFSFFAISVIWQFIRKTKHNSDRNSWKSLMPRPKKVGTPTRETAGIRIPTEVPVRKVYLPLKLPIESIKYIFNLKLLTFEIKNNKYL